MILAGYTACPHGCSDFVIGVSKRVTKDRNSWGVTAENLCAAIDKKSRCDRDENDISALVPCNYCAFNRNWRPGSFGGQSQIIL